MHRPRDVLAHVLEGIWKPVANMLVDCARDADAARLRQCFQPCGDVHPVAEDVVVIARADHNATPVRRDHAGA
jgi:hypothetical protein